MRLGVTENKSKVLVLCIGGVMSDRKQFCFVCSESDMRIISAVTIICCFEMVNHVNAFHASFISHRRL